MSTRYRSGTSPVLWVLVIATLAAFAAFVAPRMGSTSYEAAQTIATPSATAPSATAPSVTAPSAGAPAAAAPSATAPAPPPVATAHGVVTHLVDGDTLDITLSGKRTRIRLLNVDAPETVKPDTPVQCMGPQASTRLKQLAPLGSTVGLAFDVDRTDRYGRTLATVITPSGRNASEVLAEEGLGRAVKYGPNVADYATIVAAQHRAQAAHLGLYSGACG